jgi:hypothetical protein
LYVIIYSFQEGDESPLILATPCQIVAGTGHYNFELSAWHKKGDKWNFEIRSVKVSEEHTEQWLYIPFSALPELRQEIVDILEEHDGSQRIGEIPTIPEWATQGFSFLFNSKANFVDQFDKCHIASFEFRGQPIQFFFSPFSANAPTL